MLRTSILAAMIVFGISTPGCKKDTSKGAILSIEDMLVKNNEITGWTYSGSSWVANNGSELTTQIDGGAELYIKYGFIEATYQKYAGTINNISCEIQLFIYNLGSATNTSGIFDDPDLGLSSALVWSDNPAGTKAKYVRGGGLSQTMFFYRDKYLIDLTVTTDNEQSLDILKAFAINVDGKVKEALK